MSRYNYPSKYHSAKCSCRQGHTHDSRREAERCNELSLLERAGLICDLKQQVTFELIPAEKYRSMPNERSVKYIADFVYTDADGVTVIEDSKGMRTREYVIKRKLLKKIYCNDKTVFREV